jgi:hypothetical protein
VGKTYKIGKNTPGFDGDEWLIKIEKNNTIFITVKHHIIVFF